MKKLHKFAIASVLALTAMNSQAALINSDWKAGGDSLATLDTSTGIEWLDVSLTRGKSINEVLSELSTLYVGWRLPTQNEVFTLFKNAFTNSAPLYFKEGVAHGYYNFNVYDYEHHNFTFSFGDTYTPWYSYGSYVTDDGYVRVAGAGGTGAPTSSVVYFNYIRGTTLNIGSGYDGVFLVSDGGATISSQLDPTRNQSNPNAPINNQPAPVNGPTGLMLAMLGLAFFYRKNTQKA